MAQVRVRIGEMRTRIKLQSPAIGTDSGAAQKAIWANEATLWARRINAHGQEAIANESAQASQTARLTLRYYPAVQAAWRVIMDGKAWRIVAPPDHIQDGNRYTELLVQLTDGSIE